MSLHDALGGMRSIPQWFIWRLVWSPEEQKYLKTPCALDGSVYRIDASLRENWNTYSDVCAAITALPKNSELTYALGFWMTAECGYWFFDLDKCVNDVGVCGAAGQLMALFPGALMEYSSSGKGVHIIGNTVDGIRLHRTKPPKEIKAALHPMEIEFYTEGRGIAFGLSGLAQGSADSLHDASVDLICATYFPPIEEGEEGSFDRARPDWKGPSDDDELIRRALQARVSAASAFGAKATFAQLWRGECEKDSEHDLALAAHLAFWTGCDAPRIERLMRKSGMYREKWDSHRTYLNELTIPRACAGTQNVYREPERNMAPTMQQFGIGEPAVGGMTIEQAAGSGGLSTVVMMPAGSLVSQELFDRVDEFVLRVNQCGTLKEVFDLMPEVQAARIPPAVGERLVKAFNKQLDFYDNKMAVAKLRTILCPPLIADTKSGDVPEWVQRHCYVKEGDYFYDLGNGAVMSMQGFIAEYGRCMPIKENGSRENAAEWALHRWNMTTVHRIAYRPDEPTFFTWDGLDHANKYNPATVTETATAWTEKGVAGIEAFKVLLWDMCGKREEVYSLVLQWMAHNVQKPGHKIRWSPIFKGVQGDGKSIVGVFMRAAMGWRHVSITGNSTLTANGGFNDWAVSAAVNVIEEIMLVGKPRHQIYNAMKEFIGNDVANINPKGDKTYMVKNITNHLATTNHNDALPLEPTDRRWLVIFTPWASLDGMAAVCGLSRDALYARFRTIDYAMKHCGGELRAWLLSVDTSAFDPDANALWTPEKSRMMASSRDDLETIAGGIIAEGAYGVTDSVLSSSCLMNILKTRAVVDSFEIPKTTNVNHLLTRLGFSQLEKPVKWQGKAHRLWIRNGISENSDDLRKILDSEVTRLQVDRALVTTLTL